MFVRKLLPAMVGLVLPIAAMTVTTISAQAATHTHKASHHVHKVSHKSKTHASVAPKEG